VYKKQSRAAAAAADPYEAIRESIGKGRRQELFSFAVAQLLVMGTPERAALLLRCATRATAAAVVAAAAAACILRRVPQAALYTRAAAAIAASARAPSSAHLPPPAALHPPALIPTCPSASPIQQPGHGRPAQLCAGGAAPIPARAAGQGELETQPGVSAKWAAHRNNPSFLHCGGPR